MEIRVLGPLAVVRDGLPVTVSRPRCRALLAYLVGRHPHGTTLDVVTTDLWPNDDPEKAANSARVHFTHLRTALMPDDVIPRGSGRYRLDLDDTALDVARFDAAATEGRALAAAGDPEQAIRAFERALDEWRGEPYSEFVDLDAFRGLRMQLHDQRLTVFEHYSRALLDHDCADEVTRLLPAIVDANPGRESLAENLMLAQWATGRRDDALAVFAHVKQELREQHGIDPGPDLRRVADAIIMDDDTLGSSTSQDRGVALRHAPRQRTRDSFVGRIADQRALESTFHTAVSGRPQLAFVHGPAGIGKSRLVEHFARQHDGDAQILVGFCDPDVGETYQPFAQLVRQALSGEDLSDTPPDLLADLSPLAPDLAGSLPTPTAPADSSAGRLRLFDAVAGLLAAPHTPRVLIIEDIHWAREDAIAALRHLLRSARGQLLVVGVYRTDRVPDSEAFAHARSTGRLAAPDLDLPLEALADAEIAALIDARAPASHRSAWQASLAELVDVSAGNPLRLVEVLHHLEQDPDTEISEIAPDTVTALMRRRLATCDAVTLRALRAAAVLGRQFPIEAIAAVARISADEALDAMEDASDAGIVEEAPGLDMFRFHHPLYRNALYGAMTDARRSRLHLLAGEQLVAAISAGTTAARWADAARHLVTAAPRGDAHLAFDAAAKAGEEADAQFAHREAMAWFSAALEIAPSDLATEAADRIRLRHASAVELAGDIVGARDARFRMAALARDRGDHETLVAAVSAAVPSTAVLEADVADGFAGLIESAISVLHERDPRVGHLLRAGVLVTVYHRREQAEGYGRRLREYAANHPSPEATRLVQLTELTLTEGRRLHPVIDDARRPLEVSTRPGWEVARGIDERRVLHELLRAGELADFDALLAEMQQRAQVTRIPLHLYYVASMTATRRLTMAATDTTEEYVRAAGLTARRFGIFDGVGQEMLHLFILRLQQQRGREMIGNIQRHDVEAPKVVAGTSLLALALGISGRTDEARGMLDAVVGKTVDLQWDNFRVGATALFAGVAARCGSPTQRDTLEHELEPYADQLIVFGTVGAVVGCGAHWLGALAAARGDLDDAREHFTRAADFCYKADVPFWHQRARDLRDLVDAPAGAGPG